MRRLFRKFLLALLQALFCGEKTGVEDQRSSLVFSTFLEPT